MEYADSLILEKRHALGEPLSEYDIVLLNHFFWQPGIRTIHVPSQEEGRFLLETFLAAGPAHKRIGGICLSDSFAPFGCENIAKNLHKEIAQPDWQFLIDQFILQAFVYDFVWIELPSQLEKSHWLAYFIKQLHAFDMGKEIPILLFAFRYNVG